MSMRVGPTTAKGRLWLALLTVYIVWGSTYLAIRVAVRTLPPFLMAGTRFLLAGGILLAWAARRGDAEGDPRSDPIGRRQWMAAAIVGGLLLLGGNGGVVWAETRVTSGVAALIVATVPIWMAVFAARRTAERIRRRIALGLALGFGGTALLVSTAGSGGGRVDLIGAGLLVFASISWAFGSVWSKSLPLPRRAFVATALEMLAGGALLTVAGFATGELSDLHASSFPATSLLAFAYLVVFGSLAGFSAYVWLLKNASTSIASTYAYVNPVIAVFLGWAILGEHLGPLTALAAGIIVGAVVLIVRGQQPAPEGESGSPADAPVSAGTVPERSLPERA